MGYCTDEYTPERIYLNPIQFWHPVLKLFMAYRTKILRETRLFVWIIFNFEKSYEIMGSWQESACSVFAYVCMCVSIHPPNMNTQVSLCTYSHCECEKACFFTSV